MPYGLPACTVIVSPGHCNHIVDANKMVYLKIGAKVEIIAAGADQDGLGGYILCRVNSDELAVPRHMLRL